MTTLARANTKEAQLRRLIETAQAAGLTIHEIIVGPREMRLRTQPLGKSIEPEDAADRWLRERRRAREVAEEVPHG